MANETYSEKVSVNMNSATLASIDLLVDNGYYSNRSDFINQAVRQSLRDHRSDIDRIVEKNEKTATHRSGNLTVAAPAVPTEPELPAARMGNHWFLGVSDLSRREVEALHAAGETLRLKGYGVLIIDEDCDEEMLFSVVEEITVRGKVKASDRVKKHYGLK